MSQELLSRMVGDIERDMEFFRLRERAKMGARLGDAMEQLESAECSIEKIVDLTPRLICELGFDRAIISQVDSGVKTSVSTYFVDDDQWAHEINEIGREHPQLLTSGVVETEIVRRREGTIVNDVQTQAGTHRAVAEASHSRSYVAVPILSKGRVIGLLHADRYRQKRQVDEPDLHVLVSFSHGLRLALSRAQLSQELQSAEADLMALTRAMARAGTNDHALRLQTSGGEPIAVPPGLHVVPLPALPGDLTNREIQVLELLAQGRTNSAIARELVIAEGTVKQHVQHVLRKLNAGNRTEAIAMWFRAAGPGS